MGVAPSRVSEFIKKRTPGEWLALAAIALFIALFFKPVVAGDGFGYYVILEGAVRDHSLNLANQLHYNNVTNGTTVFYNAPTARYASQYAPGLPLLSAPLYAVSLALGNFRFFHVADDFFLAERGDILIHMASVALTSLVFVAVAIILGLLLLEKLGLKKHAPLALLAAFFGSPLIRYATYDLTYTHAVEAGLVAIAVYLFFTRENKPEWLGAVIGVATMVRYTSLLFLIPFAAYYLWQRKQRRAITACLAAVPFVALVMMYWWAQFGSPFTPGYVANGNLAGNLSLLPTGIPAVLFSMQPDPQALLLWTPLVALSLAGLLLWKDKRKWVLIGLFLVLLWATGSSYHGTTGFSFSHRYFAALFIVFLVGTAVLLERVKWAVWPVAAATLWTLLLFVLHIAGEYPVFATIPSVWQYWFGEGRLAQLPARLFDKLGIIRLLARK